MLWNVEAEALEKVKAMLLPSTENDRRQSLLGLSPSKQEPRVTRSDERQDPSRSRLCNHSDSTESSRRMSRSLTCSSRLSTRLPLHRNIRLGHPSLTLNLSPHGLLCSSRPPASMVTHGICHQWKLLHLQKTTDSSILLQDDDLFCLRDHFPTSLGPPVHQTP